MKARRVKKLDPAGTLAENLERIVRVRLDELHSFEAAARDPQAVDEIHDMRIAAKRLRYILEMAEPVFGAPARDGARAARRLQDLLGEIHDCDELLPWARRHAERLRNEDAAAVRGAAADRLSNGAAKGGRRRSGDPEDLPPGALAHAPHRDRYRGVEAVAVYATARRELLYARFLELWAELAEGGFRERVERGVAA